MSWLKKPKKYRRPKKPFDSIRMSEENELAKKYGLKSKREIWKADFAVDNLRRRAKELITAGYEEQKKLFEKLQASGFKVNNIPDVLALIHEDWLKRRLQSIVTEKGFVRSPKQARQLITHKRIKVDGKIVNIPSYQVSVEEEGKITLVEKKKREKKAGIEKINEVKPENIKKDGK